MGTHPVGVDQHRATRRAAHNVEDEPRGKESKGGATLGARWTVKVYTSDEIAYEITEHDIPDQLAVTGPNLPELQHNQAVLFDLINLINDAHLIGAIEGWMTRDRSPSLIPDESTILDDEEYPAQRRIRRYRTVNEYGDNKDTVFMEARFGRDKKWVMAVNRRIPELGRIAVMEWIDNENRDEVEQ